MDQALTAALIDRDWASFVAQARRLGLGTPIRDGTRIDLIVVPRDTQERFRAVLLCDEYDAVAPLLDFADPETGRHFGREYWPRMEAAPYNEIPYRDRALPILCTPGTRGYHLHSSHCTEVHDRCIWTLPRQASLVSRLMTQMGQFLGQGL